jgi:hypothetical protein
MPRRNRKTFRQQDKVVFVLDANSQNRSTPKSEDTYNYVRCMIDVMLRKSHVTTGKVFIGGSTRDLCMWISGILEFYQYKDIEIHDNTYIFDEDPDFDVPNNFY